MAKPTWESNDMQFRYLVLQALWCIITNLVLIRRAQGGPGSGADYGEAKINGNMLDWLDQHGRPGEEPKKYRREVSFREFW